MRHQKTRHKLSRDSAHRKALLANLCIEVIDHERIKTTEAKAKAVKPEIEKLITLARRGDLHARRQAISILQPRSFMYPTCPRRTRSDIGTVITCRMSGPSPAPDSLPGWPDRAPLMPRLPIREPEVSPVRDAVPTSTT